MITQAPLALLDSLDPAQRAAATLPDGPAQVIAPAGSGKTTTLIARLGVLLDRGVEAERILVVTFNRDAAAELSSRVRDRLVPTVPSANGIEVRTLHALARQVLLDAGYVGPFGARSPAAAAGGAPAGDSQLGRRSDEPAPPDAGRRWIRSVGLEGRGPSAPVEAGALPLADFGGSCARRGARSTSTTWWCAPSTCSERDAALRVRWQGRFSHLAVDEFQDVDAAQLRLVRILAEPEQNLFVVGDDDQTIYAWRLADVRRILDFERYYPAARRVQLRPTTAAHRRWFGIPAAGGGQCRALREADRAGSGRSRVAGAVSVVSTADPQWPDRVAALAGREAAEVGRCCLLARTRAELGRS